MSNYRTLPPRLGRGIATLVREVGTAGLLCLALLPVLGCASTPSSQTIGPRHVEVQGETRVRTHFYR